MFLNQGCRYQWIHLDNQWFTTKSFKFKFRKEYVTITALINTFYDQKKYKYINRSLLSNIFQNI